MKVILATTNKGKQKEFQALLEALDIQVITSADLDPSLIPDVVEDGVTFEENALKKAQAFHEVFQLPALADDSGLEVEYLNGEPGVYSARYAGEEKSDMDNNKKLLHALSGVPREQRKAHFTCVIAYVDGLNKPILARGTCAGYITEESKGEGGFGYDPVFFLPAKNKTMAEIPRAEKNKLSHRSKALKNLVKELNTTLLTNDLK